jgi:hypothetical protein
MKHYGPFTIIKVLSQIAFQSQLPPLWKIHKIYNVFHASYLSPYQETPKYGANFVELLPDNINGEQEWKVEQIIGMCYYG